MELTLCKIEIKWRENTRPFWVGLGLVFCFSFREFWVVLGWFLGVGLGSFGWFWVGLGLVLGLDLGSFGLGF